MPTAIEFNNISKLYRLGLVSSGTLSNDLKRWWQMNILGKEDPFLKVGSVNDRSKAADSEYVWALKDIDFKVEQGDVVGIIGKNGAGKSTLLKLLSKVTGPTTGTIKAKGRIASLLEVGTGFHSELTGRENIYMNGTILGMTKKEIDKKIDEIVDFSGCERYIDTPVKRYSSGMTVRLGFAVAAHLDPEILVVDEVLAVGDAEFQKKAIGKMQDVSQGEGRTVLFVSHNMESIKNLCKSGVILENGKTVFFGTATECVNKYIDAGRDTFITETKITDKHRKYLRYKQIEILSVKLLNESPYLAMDEDVVAEVKMKRNEKSISKFTLEIMVYDVLGRRVGAYISKVVECNGDDLTVIIGLSKHNLAKGKYYLGFNVGLKTEEYDFVDYDIVFDVLSINIEYIDKKTKKEIKLWRDDWGSIQFQNGFIDIK
ncbi:MAG: ATP-binding cassette domain-containing protein [Bacteroidales bacterium]|nr:ATP-binding cassette domain-containing protein [Bacteroidales bacterium]